MSDKWEYNIGGNLAWLDMKDGMPEILLEYEDTKLRIELNNEYGGRQRELDHQQVEFMYKLLGHWLGHAELRMETGDE